MAGEDRRGVWLALGAYVVWGLLPVYWKALHAVPAISILANRIVWSAVFVALVLTVRRNWGWLRAALHSRRIVLTYVGAAAALWSCADGLVSFRHLTVMQFANTFAATTTPATRRAVSAVTTECCC